MSSENDKANWFSVTNLLVVISIAANGVIFSMLSNMDNKLFVHLTNSNLHIPRETVVSKDEFTIYQLMRDRQVAGIKESIDRIELLLKEHIQARK